MNIIYDRENKPFYVKLQIKVFYEILHFLNNVTERNIRKKQKAIKNVI